MARKKKPQKSARHQYAGKMRHMKMRYEQPDRYYELQRNARAARSAESLSAAGKVGAARVIKKYGKDFLLKKLADYRNANLTPGEQHVRAILEQINAVYTTNEIIAGYVVDFFVQDCNDTECIVEFFGGIHNDRVKDPQKEAARLSALETLYRVLVIRDDDVKNQTAQGKIEEFLYSSRGVESSRDDDELGDVPF